ncbi:MAG: dockerin type I repeat-containing protein [Oscillospiraceae bacterium]|nr:dockerin type I repeat-containing protein [Oscillospiraceae bacterium]
MKHNNLFLTRCLAVLLALALCLGNVSTGLALTVFAADNSEKTNVNAASTAQNEQMNADNGSATSAYKLAAQLYGNEVAAAILNSGALAGDIAVNYSLPTVEGLTLDGGILTAETQDAWVPYAYGPAFDNAAAYTFDGNTAEWETKTVFVTYKMAVADGIAADEAFLKSLKAQYDDQKAAMADLLDWKVDMEELSRMKLRVFNSIISGYDFTEEDNDPNDAKNLELRAYFQDLIENLLNTCSGETYLTVVDMLNVFMNNGMVYFYQNSAAIREEVAKLSANLNGLVGDKEKEDALAELMDLFNYGHYIELIADLGEAMESIHSRLAYDNAGILTTSAKNLKSFVDVMDSITAEDIALADGEIYIIASPLMVTDDSIIAVTIEVTVNGETVSVPVGAEYDLDVVITEEIVENIIEVANETVTETITEIIDTLNAEQNLAIEGDLTRFFDIEIDEEGLKAMVGENIGKLEMPKLNIQPKPFIIRFVNAATRMAEQYVITILDRTIELPQISEDRQFRFEYYLNGQQIGMNGFYTFSPDEMDELFEDQTLVLDRVVIDRRVEMINMFVNALKAEMGEDAVALDGNTLTITLPSASAASDMATGVVNSNIGYVGLNNEAFFYNEGEFQRLSMQALLNAVLADPNFTNETIIALAENEGGKLMTTTAQLGTSTEDIVVEDLELVFVLESVPSKLITLGNGLKAVKNNFTFETAKINTVDGEFNALTMNLYAPEKIYEAYLAVLLASFELDQSNINDINNEIAVEFFYDYVDAVLGSENISMQTFQNTLDIAINTANYLPKIEIADRDIMHLAKYFDLINDLYKNITYYPMGEAAGQMLATTSDEGLKQIMELIGFEFSAEIAPLVAELQPGAETYFWATADLLNTSIDFEALVLDLDAAVEGTKDLYHAYQNGELKEEALNMAKGYGLTNAADFTTNLSERAAELTGQAVIVLMGDTEGDLVINEATILDLNGHTINGNVIAKNGHLLIVDSTMSNNQAGGVNGDVSGHVMIISGNYTDDVTAFLKDGYTQNEDGMVYNELFRIEKNGTDLTYYLNSDVMHEQAVSGLLPNMGVVAAEIAIDIALNQYPLTYLAVEGKEIMHLNVEDIIGAVYSIVNSDLLRGTVNDILDNVSLKQVKELAKDLAAELEDFAAIAMDLTVSDFLNEVPSQLVETKQILINCAEIAKDLAAELKEFVKAAEDVKEATGLRDAAKKLYDAIDFADLKALAKELAAELKAFGAVVKSINVPTNYDELSEGARKLVDMINAHGIAGLAIDVAAEVNDFVPYANALYSAIITHEDGIKDTVSDYVDVLLNNDIINFGNLADLAKEIAADLMNFDSIAASINNDEKIGSYEITVAPWDLTVDHIYGNGKDYLTVGFECNPDEMKTVNVGFAFEGENVKQFVKLLVELKHIFDPERSYLDIDIFRPTTDNGILSLGGTIEGRLSFDLTVPYNADGAANCYPAIVAVALAYANEDNRAELVAALNADNDYLRSMALKNAIDNCSVEDVISAMKLMNRTTSFYEMAEAIGVNVTVEEAELEVIWHFVTVCFGKLLEIGEEIGRESLLGSLDKDNDGVYVLESTYSADADIYSKGYGLYINAEKLYECFEVKVFDLDCLWGDVNHDGYVNAKDATLVLQYSVGTNEGFFCEAKADVNGDGFINAKDATLILQHSVGTITKFPVEE